ncbi:MULTISPECIES: histidine phosphatase family protein [unclassified Leifsonia]|uniref:histidine phosphatase family protein n=1 Tax=unclassified Leifsonia TaxID=2663824 RepID=UPI0006FBBC07|nr:MULTISPECIES: histidine phosphatase family protein [unclassified Leifsonia]KQX07621.1 phosphoglycerate mutase [Leifsonia sp. Root1293]KRA11903.1 phosphoglycerate mutase [Leifsonia sp. Root60]
MGHRTRNELWLIRHGESVGNVAASAAEADGAEVIPLDIRDADVPLSPAGEHQAGALRPWLAERRTSLGAVWCSPYTRARETLAIAIGDSELAAPVHVDERLRDRELGILDLLTSDGVRRRHPEEVARRRHLGKFYHRPPGGESWADVVLRLRSFLADAAAESASDGGQAGPSGAGSTLIVAHDAIVMLLLYICLDFSEADLLDFAETHTVANASVTHLVRESPEQPWRLVEFSNVDHLAEGGAPVTVHSGDDDVQPE